MPLTHRTFRVFISSTFSDMVAERNALQERVFPNLERYCLQRGARFQAIDLRWGVRTEAGLDQQTMAICLEELGRCQRTTARLNCIVLLGNRYGWRPLPPSIPADEFESLFLQWGSDRRGLRLLVTNQPVPPWQDGGANDRNGWYRKDENARPAEYVLQPRAVELPETLSAGERERIRKDEERDWEGIEGRLRELFRLALARAGWAANDSRRIKYETSATHREILHAILGIPGAEGQVFAYLRNFRGLPDRAEQKSVQYADFDDAGQPDPEAHARLAGLRADLDRLLRPTEQLYHYEADYADWPARLELEEANSPFTFAAPFTTVLTSFCAQVEGDLKRAITAELESAEEDGVSELDREIQSHREFAADRARNFLGRSDLLRRMETYIAGTEPHPLLVHGVTGSGKSALLARAALNHLAAGQTATVLCRFVGATPGSGEVRSLLDGLCQELKAHDFSADERVPGDYFELIRDFASRLGQADRQRPLILFLDALDQLGSADNGRSLNWLPRRLPPHVRLIVSILDANGPAGACLQAARRLLPPGGLEVGPLGPAVGEKLLDQWLTTAGRPLSPWEPSLVQSAPPGERRAGRTLTEGQRQAVLAGFRREGMPLYLKLAFQEAVRWKSYDPVPRLSPDTSGILSDLFARLEQPAHHGAGLVRKSMGYLAAARHGLTEDEVVGVLSGDQEFFHDYLTQARHKLPVPRLPVVVWSRLYFDLEPYLAQRSANGALVLSFYHAQLSEAARARYLGGGAQRDAHRGLAAYFQSRPSAFDLSAPEPGPPDGRRSAELPWQQTRAELWDSLAATLCDLAFAAEKCRAGLAYDLVNDYTRAEEVWPNSRQPFASRRATHRVLPTRKVPDKVQTYQQFVQAHVHILFADPAQVLPCAHNHASGGDVVAAADHYLTALLWQNSAWIQLLDREPLVRCPAVVKTLRAHQGAVLDVALSADGCTAVSAGTDGAIKLWDLRAGELIQTIAAGQPLTGINPLLVLSMPSALMDPRLAVRRVAVPADARFVVSAGGDGCVCAWDAATGGCLQRLPGHKGGVLALCVTPDGRYALSGGEDNSARLWDLEGMRPLATLTGHKSSVTGVSISSDGRLGVTGSRDGTIRLWDLATGQTLRSLTGPQQGILGIAADRNVSVIVASAGEPPNLWGKTFPMRALNQTEIRFWSAEGVCLLDGVAHELAARHGNRLSGILSSVILGVAMTPDRRTALSVGYDGALCLWGVSPPQLLRRFEALDPTVLSVAVDPSGQFALLGSEEGSVRVVDLSGEHARRKRGGRRRIGAVGTGRAASVADRSRLLWSNRRMRTWVVLPYLALILVSLSLLFTSRVSFVPSFLSANFPLGDVLNFALAGLAAWLLLLTVAWHVTTGIWFPIPIRTVVLAVGGLPEFRDWPLLPLMPFFKVLNCPCCGLPVCGRRHLFHCASCDFEG